MDVPWIVTYMDETNEFMFRIFVSQADALRFYDAMGPGFISMRSSTDEQFPCMLGPPTRVLLENPESVLEDFLGDDYTPPPPTTAPTYVPIIAPPAPAQVRPPRATHTTPRAPPRSPAHDLALH